MRRLLEFVERTYEHNRRLSPMYVATLGASWGVNWLGEPTSLKSKKLLSQSYRFLTHPLLNQRLSDLPSRP